MEEKINYAVFQKGIGKDISKLEFIGYEELTKNGNIPDFSQYECIYASQTDKFDLEELYVKLNSGLHPADYYGHSLSVGDVVVIEKNDAFSAYYCDTYGFVKLEEKVINDKMRYSVDEHETIAEELEWLSELYKRGVLNIKTLERYEYLNENYTSIIDMAKNRKLIFCYQPELKKIYDDEEEYKLPFREIAKYDGIYWFKDSRINELSREDREKRILDLYYCSCKKYLNVPLKVSNNINSVVLESYYDVADKYKLTDTEGNKYTLYIGKIDYSNERKYILCDKKGCYLYSGKLDQEIENGIKNYNDTVDMGAYTFINYGASTMLSNEYLQAKVLNTENSKNGTVMYKSINENNDYLNRSCLNGKISPR